MFEEKYYLAAICLYHEILIRSSVPIKKKVLLITEFASISGHRETHTQRGLLIEQVVFFFRFCWEYRANTLHLPEPLLPLATLLYVSFRQTGL